MKYQEDYARIAYVACSEAPFTDAKLATLFNVAKSTINEWKREHPEFKKQMQAGKDRFDSEKVERAFYKRCTGYAFTEITREPAMVDTGQGVPLQSRMVVTKRVRKHITPDAKGCMDWLCNRRPDRWKKLKHVEISGKDGGPVKTSGLVAVPSGPLSIAEWERQVKEAIANDKAADIDNNGSADDAMDTPGGSPGSSGSVSS
jgi:hypothetical protein